MSKVLLADDSTHAQRMGTNILTGEGVEVVTVSNGEAAVRKLASGSFEVVLADIFMPGRSGYEVCAYIKTNPQLSHIPVVLVVGQLEPYDPEQGRRVGADAVLKKPFVPTEVVQTVRSMIELFEKSKPVPVEETPVAAAAVEEAHEEVPVATEAPPPKVEVPTELQDAAAFDLFEDHTETVEVPDQSAAPPQPEFETLVAPTGSIGEEALPATTEDVSIPELMVAEASAQAIPEMAVPDSGGEATAEFQFEPAAVEPPAVAASEETIGDFDLPPAEEPVSLLPPEQEAEAPAPVEAVLAHEAAVARRWVIEEQPVTEADRRLFAEATGAPAVAAAAAGIPVMAAAPSAAPAEHDWSDLLKSIEEPAAQPAPAAAAVAEPVVELVEVMEEPVVPPLEITPPDVAETVAEAAESVVEPVAEAAAEPIVEVVAEPAEVVMEPAAEAVVGPPGEVVSEPLLEIAPSELAPEAAAAAPAPVISETDLRQAVERGLDKGLPGVKAVPGLVDAIMGEVAGYLKSSTGN